MLKIEKIFLILLLFIANIYAYDFNFTKEEVVWLKNHKEIVVSNQLDWYPYDYNHKGKATGYIIDYMNYIADKINLKVKYKTDSWENLLNHFNANEIDILLLAAKSKERESNYILSSKILDIRYSLVIKNDRFDLKTFGDLKGKKIALVKGWVISSVIKSKYKEINFIEFSTSKDALEAVAFGVVDAVIEDYFTANSLIKIHMLSNLHVASKVDLFDEYSSLHIMAQKENKTLINIINKVIVALPEHELLGIKEKWLAAVGTQLKSSVNFTDNERNYLFNKKNINMCIDPDWMPLEKNDNGNHIGMSSDYMRLLQDKINIPITMVNTKSWLESIEFAKSRKCDIYSLAMPTPERKLYMDFTKPYLKIPLVLVTRNNEIFYSDVSAITDKKIGIVEGYAYGEILKVKYPNMQLVNVKNLKEGLDSVENGNMFGFIGTLATVGYNIQNSYMSQLKIAGKFEESWELGVGTRNDEPLLHSVFEKAISSIPAQAHQEILNKWISVNYERGKDYSLFYKLLGVLCIVGLFIVYRQYELKKYNKQLKILSTTDTLTGVVNRMKLDEILNYEKSNFDRYKKEFSIILIDIDDFKEINDKFGHHIGDNFLKEFSHVIKTNMRASDTLGRWGGEEFLIISPLSDIEGAQKLAQKLKDKINEHNFTLIGNKSASFGVAQIQENEHIDELFDRADKALYTSKRLGKNRVTIDL